VNQSNGDNKPFYRTVGQGFIEQNGSITVHVLPCVIVKGGLIRVNRTIPNMLPEDLQERLDIKVVTSINDKLIYHIVGTAFKVKGKEGMYSLSLPNDVGLYGSFVLQNPTPKQDK
jgi:hypothetical protein